MNIDETLVARSVDARDAFDELVQRHYQMVYSVAYAYVGQREAAEEVAQETFLRAYLNLHTLNNPAAFSGWVMRIARNLAENWRVRNQTRSRLAAMVPIDEQVLELPDRDQELVRDKLATKQETEAVQKALQKLPPPDRELVLMHFLEGISKSDLARRMGVYPSTIGRQLDKALSLLRQELGSLFPETGRALAPSRKAIARTILLIAAAGALPGPAKAALVTAAVSTAEIGVISDTTTAPAHTGAGSKILSLPNKTLLFVTSGGTKMLVAQLLAIGAVALGVLRVTIGEASGPEVRPAASPATTIAAAPERLVAASQPLGHFRAEAPAPAEVAPAESDELQLIASWEAEKCKITSVYGRVIDDSWGSSAQYLGDSWADKSGDAIEWEAQVQEALVDLKLAVRYAFKKPDYIRREGVPQGDHVLHLYIDGQGPHIVNLADTWNWNWFGISSIDLPPLEAGVHSFKLVAPADHNAVNLDCVALYRGKWMADTNIGPLRPSVLQVEHNKLAVLTTPTAKLPEASKSIFAALEQLKNLMVDDFGRQPHSAHGELILVHFTDPDNWDTRHGRAIKNQHGVYLLGDGKSTRADWCWSVAEYFADQRVPRWFKDSSSRVSGLLDWLPALKSDTLRAEDEAAAMLVEEARLLLDDENSSTTRVEVVHTALRQKYGHDIFRKFWHALQGTPEQLQALGVTDPTRGPHGAFDKAAIMAILNHAAGEDVTPLYRRWTGFAMEGPVDPLVVTNVNPRL